MRRLLLVLDVMRHRCRVHILMRLVHKRSRRSDSGQRMQLRLLVGDDNRSRVLGRVLGGVCVLLLVVLNGSCCDGGGNVVRLRRRNVAVLTSRVVRRLVNEVGVLRLGGRQRDADVRRLTVNDRIEAGVLVGGVLDDALEAIGVDQLVASVDGVTVARLLLRFDVAGVLIVDGVGEIVVGRRVGVVLVLDGDGAGDGGQQSDGCDELECGTCEWDWSGMKWDERS